MNMKRTIMNDKMNVYERLWMVMNERVWSIMNEDEFERKLKTVMNDRSTTSEVVYVPI